MKGGATVTTETQNTKFLKMSASPHVHSDVTTRKLMLDVLIALVPALVWAVYVFGPRALAVTAVSAASAVIFEYLYRKLMHKTNTVGDLSAAVTGVLLAFTLPATIPLWMPVVGAAFAIIIVKQLYGGIGKNVVNPALAARVFLFLSFSNEMSFGKPQMIVDTEAAATPLVALQEGTLPATSLFDAFTGYMDGSLGEVSVTLLVLGGVWLLARRVITWHIPVSFIGTVALLTFLFPKAGIGRTDYMLYELCAGGLMLGAIFMATDYVTSPFTKSGRLIYGVGCGVITVFIRAFGYPEGVSFAILVMNLLTFAIDQWTMPRRFGAPKGKPKKA